MRPSGSSPRATARSRATSACSSRARTSSPAPSSGRSPRSGKYTALNTGGADGSQTAAGFLYDNTDATAADVSCHRHRPHGGSERQGNHLDGRDDRAAESDRAHAAGGRDHPRPAVRHGPVVTAGRENPMATIDPFLADAFSHALDDGRGEQDSLHARPRLGARHLRREGRLDDDRHDRAEGRALEPGPDDAVGRARHSGAAREPQDAVVPDPAHRPRRHHHGGRDPEHPRVRHREPAAIARHRAATSISPP